MTENVDLPTCKLCGWTASANEPQISGPEIFTHWQRVHPEVWEEFLPLLKRMWMEREKDPAGWSAKVQDWYTSKTVPMGAGRSRKQKRKKKGK